MARRLRELPVWPYEPGSGLGRVSGTDRLAEEAPLRLRVRGHDLGILMRTPGDDEALAAGFLWTEGFLRVPEDLEEVRLCLGGQIPEHLNVAEAMLAEGAAFDLGGALRTGLVSSSCSVCGRTSIAAVLAARPMTTPPVSIDPSLLGGMAERLAETQDVFSRTGGLHGAGLFEADGTRIHTAEDVGRHNAVDKVLGMALLEGRWPPPPVLLTTSRGSFDIVQKAAMAGIQLVALMSAPSSLAVELATSADITLVGFLRGERFVVYSGRERLVPGSGGRQAP